MKPDASETGPAPTDPGPEGEANELRMHYSGLAHFFAAFEPLPASARPTPGKCPAVPSASD